MQFVHRLCDLMVVTQIAGDPLHAVSILGAISFDAYQAVATSLMSPKLLS
jgi:hypothetical protein